MPKNEHTTNKGKNKQIHTIMEHKTVINITEINKYKKLNMTEHKTDMNKKKKQNQQFYEEAQNRHQQY